MDKLNVTDTKTIEHKIDVTNKAIRKIYLLQNDDIYQEHNNFHNRKNYHC